ncbi:sensor histidine kinase [Microbacterium gorillae]|uniref:sensor histidine kinase n=1 Tax=Microbacterium gorillae TaxID=1231063 RepID=UPI0018A84E3D|nr:histidine kinase [Microbacterium gorillae]
MGTFSPCSSRARPTPPALRGVREGSLERALLFLLVVGLLLGIGQVCAAYAFSDAGWAALLFGVVYAIWLGAGVLAWWRRPGNGVGALILLGAISIHLGGIANVPAPAYVLINAVFATMVLAVTVHILHAFPSGRLRGRLSIATVVLGYVVSIGFDLVNTVLRAVNPSGIPVVSAVQTALGILVMVVTAVVLARRLVLADRVHRRILLPLYAYGIVSVLAAPLLPLVLRPRGVDTETIAIAQLAVLAGLPIAFLLGVLLGGFRRTTAIEALSAWLAIGGATRPSVGRALAATLGDESLEVVYWDPERDAYMDENGHEVPRDEKRDRGWIDVRVDDRLVGAIGYDALIMADAAAVRRAGEVLAIAIDRERLTTQLLASNEELTRSRLRLVEATYRERSRVARDLHDGLQVQLVLLALEAQKIANAPDASPATGAAAEQLRHGIDAAAAELRDLVHNVLPASLFERGLVAAAEDLVDRLEIPATLTCDADESSMGGATTLTAYFVLAEALANAAKHSRAARVDVRLHQSAGRLHVRVDDDGVGEARVEDGTGLRGLFDRVAAVDGTMRIDSRPGHGTRVEVDLPCG